MKTICVLGRQPALGLAELESLFGSEAVKLVQPGIALTETAEPIKFNCLGGTLKACQILVTLETTEWDKIFHHLITNVPDHLHHFTPGKLTIGLSLYGWNFSPAKINAAGLAVKKSIKAKGRSVRLVPTKELTLNTAQILHNNLDKANGLEINIIKAGDKTIIGRTIWVQDIEAYRRRDQMRPKRDSRVGMLPPKLAQVIINLALGKNNSDPAVTTILDPFCGTGVILQEAVLMGYPAAGSDFEPRMIEYTRENLEWLSLSPEKLIVADATSQTWEFNYQTVAAETYLGRALSAVPDPSTLQKIIQDGNSIHKKFLENLASQTNKGFRLCIAIPAWHINGRVHRLPFLDHLEKLGYNRLSFVHVDNSDLIYHRSNQIVGRELVVLIRK